MGVTALTLTRRAQTQTVPEQVAPQGVASEGVASEGAAGGSASPVFSYQGQLLDNQGNPVTDSVPMIFRLFDTATDGNLCWEELHTGANEVEVVDGRFSILLGSITPTDATCLAEAAYLELQINGETLSPRQLFTSVAEATTLSARAIAKGEIEAATGLPNLQIRNDYGNSRLIAAENLYFFMDSDNNSTGTEFVLSRNNNRFDPPVETVFRVEENGHTTITSDLSVYGPDINLGNDTALRRDGRDLHLLPWGGAGHAYDRVCIGCGSSANLTVNGNLEVNGSCNASIEGDDVATSGETCTAGNITTGSLTAGAVIEANLMTPAERAAGHIGRFTQGDVQCWSTKTERLETCDQANTRLVMAVADANGLPIVQGAEPVKVLGPVVAGDLLVASAVPGYAMVNNNPAPGTVIGKAMEDFNGGRGLIKVMISQ